MGYRGFIDNGLTNAPQTFEPDPDIIARDGIVAWYPFVERGGLAPRDFSGKGYVGTMHNMETSDWGYDSNGAGRLDFGGTDEVLDIGLMPGWAANWETKPPGGSFWIQSTSTTSSWVFGCRNGTVNTRLDLNMNKRPVAGSQATGRWQLFVDGEGGSAFTGGVDTDTGTQDGNLHLIDWQFDPVSNVLGMQIDGVEQAVIDNGGAPSAFAAFTRTMTIGGFNNGTPTAPLTPAVFKASDWQFRNKLLPAAARTERYTRSRWALRRQITRNYFVPAAAVGGGNPWNYYAQM